MEEFDDERFAGEYFEYTTLEGSTFAAEVVEEDDGMG